MQLSFLSRGAELCSLQHMSRAGCNSSPFLGIQSCSTWSELTVSACGSPCKALAAQLGLCRSLSKSKAAETGSKADISPNSAWRPNWFSDSCCMAAATCGVKSSRKRQQSKPLVLMLLEPSCSVFVPLACHIPFCTLTFLNLFCICHIIVGN